MSLNLSKNDIDKIREKGKRNLFFFAKGILGYDWLTPHIHKPICDMLHPSNTRVGICIPRGWLKSTIGSIAYPIHRAVNNPNTRTLIVQNTHTNAQKKLKAIRGQVMGNDLFRALYFDILPDKGCIDNNEALEFKRTKKSAEATFEIAGTNSNIVSRHYDTIIEDDTVSPKKSEVGEDNILPSKEDVKQAIGLHKLVLPLLVDPLTSQNIIIGTRWFERDLISYSIDNEKNFQWYIRSCRENDMGEPDKNGHITYPERFPKSVLEELEVSMGPYLFSCLYYNLPVRSEDMIFDPSWYCYYEDDERPNIKDLEILMSVDLASDPETTKGDPDYNVVLVTGKDKKTGIIYVLHYYRARCTPNDVIDEIFRCVNRYKCNKVIIEGVAYQGSMIYWIKEKQKEMGCYFNIEKLTHGKRSKNTRIQGLQPLVHNGKLMFKRDMTELTGELTAFPLSQYDDVCDCLSMQIPYWNLTKFDTTKNTVSQSMNEGLKMDDVINDILNRNSKPSYVNRGVKYGTRFKANRMVG